MEITVSDSHSTTAEAVMRALSILNDGGLVCLPVHGQYAIVGNVFFSDATERMRGLGLLQPSFPMAVLIHDPHQLAGLAEPHPNWVQELIDSHWPGPLTVVLEALPDMPWDLGPSQGTVQLSCPNNPVVRAVLAESGPLACIGVGLIQGVNPSTDQGETVEAAQEKPLPEGPVLTGEQQAKIDLIVREALPDCALSTIIDGLKDGYTLLRKGDISPHQPMN